jgi:hypothetical protein
MKRIIVSVLALFLASAWANQEQEDALHDAQTAFVREVGGISIDSPYSERLVQQTESLLLQNREKFDSSQFFLLVNRNHGAQEAFLAFYDGVEGKVTLIGGDKVSTGNPTRRGHFETPTGIFENKPTNMSYRALGTKNKLGWRGLGGKGSRVWDLGWQRTVKGRGEPMDIRMLVHATDPGEGEKRLGTIQSMGCVRVSSRFNRFLDYYGVLDQEYEGNVRAKYVLLKVRNPISFSGKFVVVIDSE